MPKTNSKNIRIFKGWFGIDNKSMQKELGLCELLYINYPHTCEQSSDKTGFWVEQNNCYYKYKCDNGQYFNYPVEIDRDLIIDDSKIIKIDRIYIGKIVGSAQKHSEAPVEQYSENDARLYELAKQDLAEHPVKEEKFDWQHIKTVMDKEPG